MKLRIQLLGGLAVHHGHGEIRQFRTRKTASLLSYLAYHLYQEQSRQALAEYFWPSGDYDSPNENLNQTLYSLRKQLEPPGVPAGQILCKSHHRVSLSRTAVITDVVIFRELVSNAKKLTIVDERMNAFQSALNLYTGDLLPNCDDDWVDYERTLLKNEVTNVMQELVKIHIGRRDLNSAGELARKIASLEPDREDWHWQVINIYATEGRIVAAKNYFEAVRKRFARNYGKRLSAGFRSRVQELGIFSAQGDVSSAIPKLPAHNLRKANTDFNNRKVSTDLIRPGIYSGGTTTVIGRESEIVWLMGSIGEDKPCRVITVTGMGGIGKTRLVCEVAYRLGKIFAGHVAFIQLEGINSYDELVSALLKSLGLRSDITISAFEQVIEILKAFKALLIFDNAEHLIEDVRRLVSSLVSSHPAVTIWVTSRIPLSLSIEKIQQLSPLTVPKHFVTPELLMSYSAVELFVGGVQAVVPDFQITARNANNITEICQRMDGIPLAILLAAKRANVMSLKELNETLQSSFEFHSKSIKGNVDERHSTMFDTLEWSYKLLSSPAARACRLLSVFRGSFSLKGAQSVLGVPDASSIINELLMSSMLSQSEKYDIKRFTMIEVTREFSRSKVTHKEFAKALIAHSDYFTSLVVQIEPRLRSRDATNVINELAEDLSNIHFALENNVTTPNGIALASSLWRVWNVRGYTSEAKHWLTSSLDQPINGNIIDHARAKMALGIFALHTGEAERGLVLAKESVDMARRGGNQALLADTLNNLGIMNQHFEHLEEAEVHLHESLELWQLENNQFGEAIVYANLGRLANQNGNIEEATHLLSHSRKLFLELGDESMSIYSTLNLAVALRQIGRLDEAKNLYYQGIISAIEQKTRLMEALLRHNLSELFLRDGALEDALRHAEHSLMIRKQLIDKGGVAQPLWIIACVALEYGFPTEAVKLFGAVTNLRQKYNVSLMSFFRKLFEQDVEKARQSLNSTDFDHAWEEGFVLDWEDAIQFAQKWKVSIRKR